MSELFDDEDDKEPLLEEDEDEEEALVDEELDTPTLDARRRLEDLLEEKRLRNELEDFLDY